MVRCQKAGAMAVLAGPLRSAPRSGSPFGKRLAGQPRPWAGRLPRTNRALGHSIRGVVLVPVAAAMYRR